MQKNSSFDSLFARFVYNFQTALRGRLLVSWRYTHSVSYTKNRPTSGSQQPTRPRLRAQHLASEAHSFADEHTHVGGSTDVVVV